VLSGPGSSVKNEGMGGSSFDFEPVNTAYNLEMPDCFFSGVTKEPKLGY
jgi:hypothetical protein